MGCNKLADGKGNNWLLKLNELRSLFAQEVWEFVGFFEIPCSTMMLCVIRSWGGESACEPLG